MKKLVKSIKEIMKMLNPLKGEKTDKKIISEDGYYTNGVVAIKKGFDKKVDEDFKDADLMEKFNIKRLEKCMEYVAYNVVEKEKVVAIECAHSWKKDEKNKVMYMNAYTYRYLVRKDLELKFNPNTFSYAGYIEGELMIYGLGMKVNEKHFEELETIEELKIRTEKEKAEKEELKNANIKYWEQQAQDYINIYKKADLKNGFIGKEMRISKNKENDYCIELKIDLKDGQGEIFHRYANVERLAPHTRTKTDRKIFAEKYVELFNSLSEEEIREEENQKEVLKKANEDAKKELELIREEIKNKIECFDEIEIWGNSENGYYLNIKAVGEFLRIEPSYTFENVNKTLNGQKEKIQCTRKEVLRMVYDILEPKILAKKEYDRKINIIKELFKSTNTLLTEIDGKYYTFDIGTKKVSEIIRGKENTIEKIYCRENLLHYVYKYVKKVSVIDTENEKLTKKELSKKEFVVLKELYSETKEEIVETNVANGDFKTEENKMEKRIADIVETVEELSWEIQAIDVVENLVYAEVKTKYGQFKVEGLYAGMEKTEKNWKEDVDAVAVALGKKYNVEVRGITADKVEYEKREKEREEYIPQAIEKIREYNEDLLEEKEIIVTDIVNGDFGIEEVKRTTTTRQSDSLIEDFRYTFARQGKDVAFRRLDLLLSYLPKKELTQKKNNDNINITTNKQKAEEKEMDRIEMNNRKIGNAMNKLGKKLVAIKNDAQFEDKAFDIIKEIFPNACEIETAELEDVYFIAGVDYTGKAPTKKEMIEEDKHFKEVNEMYGLDIRFNVEKNKVTIGATVMVAYTDKWGVGYETNYTIKEVEIDFPEEVEEATAGEVEKIKKEGGDTMKTTAGIKRMGTAKYTHISNFKALELEELKMLNEAFDLMKEKIEFMKDVCVLKVDLKNNKVTFIQSKDWDTAREPEVGDAYSVDLVKKEIKFIKAKGQIYHHKWSFVAEDYAGFDIEKNKKWSEEWQEKLPKTREVKSRIGYKKYWEEYLEEYGLEVK